VAGVSRAIPRRIHGVRLAITATARSDRRIAVLEAIGVVPADRLLSVPTSTRVLVAGAVTHRQRPATAQGVTFINLEDETGMVNILCSPGCLQGTGG